MTLDQIRLAAHQLGMYISRADPAMWRAHRETANALWAKVGFVYEPYPRPNKDVVKALYVSLREGLIDRAEFAACMANVMGKHRV